MASAELRPFNDREHLTWRTLFERQAERRAREAGPAFERGLARLGIGPERIPRLGDVNERLGRLAGFRAVAVEGFVEAGEIFAMLARGEFPVGDFIRDARDLDYTPAPDVFHDLYGHVPLLADPAYARFCREIGRRALRHRADPQRLREFDRLFWFTVEFGLVRTPAGRRIFGAGILSSRRECEHALSGRPRVEPFSVERVRDQEFRIDELQPVLFELESPEQLYGCLDELEEGFWFRPEPGPPQAVS